MNWLQNNCRGIAEYLLSIEGIYVCKKGGSRSAVFLLHLNFQFPFSAEIDLDVGIPKKIWEQRMKGGSRSFRYFSLPIDWFDWGVCSCSWIRGNFHLDQRFFHSNLSTSSKEYLKAIGAHVQKIDHELAAVKQALSVIRNSKRWQQKAGLMDSNYGNMNGYKNEMGMEWYMNWCKMTKGCWWMDDMMGGWWNAISIK